MQTYQTYFKREFDKKRENSGVLARFVLFLAGIIQAEFTYSRSKMRAIDINLSAVGALPPSTVHEQPVTFLRSGRMVLFLICIKLWNLYTRGL